MADDARSAATASFDAWRANDFAALCDGKIDRIRVCFDACPLAPPGRMREGAVQRILGE